MNKNWKHLKTIIDSERFEINGMNIWGYDWHQTNESICIKDPLYSQEYIFSVYEISNGIKTVRFAAGEFSNCIWSIYTES
jgi:hypothetical protein